MERSECSPCMVFREGRGVKSSVGLWGTHTTICFRPRRALRMNLRVRSVTGCSLSAIFAGNLVLLAKTLGIVDVHAATDRDCVAGSLIVEQTQVTGNLRVCRIRRRLFLG